MCKGHERPHSVAMSHSVRTGDAAVSPVAQEDAWAAVPTCARAGPASRCCPVACARVVRVAAGSSRGHGPASTRKWAGVFRVVGLLTQADAKTLLAKRFWPSAAGQALLAKRCWPSAAGQALAWLWLATGCWVKAAGRRMALPVDPEDVSPLLKPEKSMPII